MQEKLLSFDETGFQFAWDSTSLSSYVACPRKYQYTILEGWQSAFKSVHLVFGGHYASALERFHKLRADGLEYWDAANSVVHQCLIDTWDKENERGQDWMDSKKTRETLIRSIVWYLDQYENDTMETVILQDGRAAVEYSFTLELSDEYLYCGHIDRLVKYGDDIYVQDQKTSGAAITQYYFNGFAPDYQMTGYTLAGQILFNLPVKGVVIDAAQIAVGFTSFGRGFTWRGEAQLMEFRDEALYYIGEAKRNHEAGYYPMRRTSCGNYGGCQFRDVCNANPAMRESLLKGKFEKKERWDPLKSR